MDQHRQKQIQMLRLPNGLSVWIKGRLSGSDGADFNHAVAVESLPVATPDHRGQTDAARPAVPASAVADAPASVAPAPSPATLVDHSQRLIEGTLAECGGNIAKAARALGVSRGMLYRRLQKNANGQPCTGAPGEAQSGGDASV
jgi:DNA-binding NtrC family response regulator